MGEMQNAECTMRKRRQIRGRVRSVTLEFFLVLSC
jgi:hypothetical protein